MKMHNDPGSWETVREMLHAWYKGETSLGAVLRIAYIGGGRKRMLLEGLLCGALTLVSVMKIKSACNNGSIILKR